MGSFVLNLKSTLRHLAEGRGRGILVRDGWVRNEPPNKFVSDGFKGSTSRRVRLAWTQILSNPIRHRRIQNEKREAS